MVVALFADDGRCLGQVLCGRGSVLTDAWPSFFYSGGCVAILIMVVIFVDALPHCSLGGCFTVVAVFLRGWLTTGCDRSPSASLAAVCSFLQV